MFEDLGFAAGEEGDNLDEDDVDSGSMAESDELEDLLREKQAWLSQIDLSDSVSAGTISEPEPEPEELVPGRPRKKKSKKVELTKPAEPTFDLVEPAFTRTSGSTSRTPSSVDTSAFGDPTALQHADVADKDARRHSLRFHTSKIDSASKRRESARTAFGGDDDIPWKTRQKEKALQEAANPRNRGLGGEDLETLDPSEAPPKRAREEESGDDDEGEDGYYQLVKKQRAKQKEQKQVAYDEAREAAR